MSGALGDARGDESYSWRRAAPVARNGNDDAEEVKPQMPESKHPDAYEIPVETGRKKAKLSALMAVFGSKQLAEGYDRETFVKITVRELLIYVVYLTALLIIAFGDTSSTSYYFTKIMGDLFVDSTFKDPPYNTFRTSTVRNDFWEFVDGPMIEGIYWHTLYGRRENGSHGILFENRILGAPRMRQLRVTADSCTVLPTFRQYVRQCYAPYDEAYEDKSKWSSLDGSAWEYTSADVSGSSSYWGELGWYSGGGSYVDLFVDESPTLPPGTEAKNATISLMKILKAEGWITRATRAVFLDFTVYNANINLFCVVKLVWEFAPTGGVHTSANMQTLQLIKYVGWFQQYVILPCEILFLIFTVYYIIQEGIEMTKMECKRYLKCIWSWIDLGIILLSVVVIVYKFLRYFVVETKTKAKVRTEGRYVNFDGIAFWQEQSNNCFAVVVFLALIKVFKFMSFNKTMKQLSTTLSRCSGDVGGFAIMFLIVFAAFAQLGYLMFGSQVKDFSTFIESMLTLLRLILGDFNFKSIEEANRILGPLYFIAYVFFVFFVLLNLFLAIINDTFGQVKAEIQSRGDKFEIADYFSRGFNNIKGLWGGKDEKEDAKYAVKLASADGRITYKELRENLERAGFTNVEIEMFLARYQLDDNRALDEDEIEQLMEQLEGQRFGSSIKRRGTSIGTFAVKTDEEIPNQILNEELESLDKRVDTIETSLSTIMRKLDDVAAKMKKIVQ